jgi:hypothetical protein
MAYRGAPKAFYGWKEGGRFYLSLEPRGKSKNEYATSREALSEASKRKRPIIWEDPKAID